MHINQNTRFVLKDSGVEFTGKIVRQAFPEELIDLFTPYRYYIVEFDTGKDKRYPRVINMITRYDPVEYKHIACETELMIIG